MNGQKISDHALYKYLVIILGNLENYTDEQIKRIIDNSDYEVFDFNRTYKELVFPYAREHITIQKK